MANENENVPKTKKPQGFATMTPERRRELAIKGGRAAQASGKAHRFTKETAVVAGRKGGYAVAENRKHMADIGSKGGKASHESKKESYLNALRRNEVQEDSLYPQDNVGENELEATTT